MTAATSASIVATSGSTCAMTVGVSKKSRSLNATPHIRPSVINEKAGPQNGPAFLLKSIPEIIS
jgi:hypothetical protein